MTETTVTKKKKLPRVDGRPSIDQVKRELGRVRYRHQYFSMLWSTIRIILLVAAVTVLISMLWMPVLRTYGVSMAPTLKNGEVLVSTKYAHFKQGDIIAMYYNNKVLIKRVIAMPGQQVDIDDEGRVTVDGIPLEEPYISETAMGEITTSMPCQVPEERYFVLGDNRKVSIDSRNSAIGCISEEQILGKLQLVIWPLKDIRKVN